MSSPTIRTSHPVHLQPSLDGAQASMRCEGCGWTYTVDGDVLDTDDELAIDALDTFRLAHWRSVALTALADCMLDDDALLDLGQRAIQLKEAKA